MMCSLIETAKINRVDPQLYLNFATLEAVGCQSIPLLHQLGRMFQPCEQRARSPVNPREG